MTCSLECSYGGDHRQKLGMFRQGVQLTVITDCQKTSYSVLKITLLNQ
jgi:hypothetical protein